MIENSTLVVVPTLGRRLHWLAIAVASVKRQGDGVRSIIVGASDSPAKVVAARLGVDYLAFDDPGLSAAINAGWDAGITGATKYLSWLGDDDVLAPNSMQLSISALDRAPDAVASYGRVRSVLSSGETYCLPRPGRLASHWLRLAADRVPQPGCLFRRTAVDAASRLDASLNASMDYDLFLRLKRRGRLLYIPHEVAAARLHGTMISARRELDPEDLAVRARDRAAATLPERVCLRLMSPLARQADAVYSAMLRRMPGGAPPMVDGVPYFSSAMA